MLRGLSTQQILLLADAFFYCSDLDNLLIKKGILVTYLIYSKSSVQYALFKLLLITEKLRKRNLLVGMNSTFLFFSNFSIYFYSYYTQCIFASLPSLQSSSWGNSRSSYDATICRKNKIVFLAPQIEFSLSYAFEKNIFRGERKQNKNHMRALAISLTLWI